MGPERTAPSTPGGADELAVGRLARGQGLDQDPELGRAGGGGEAAKGLDEEGIAGDVLGRLAEDEGDRLAAAAGEAPGRSDGAGSRGRGRRRGPGGGSVSGMESPRSFRTSETVVRETPARVATSALVTLVRGLGNPWSSRLVVRLDGGSVAADTDAC